MHYKIDGADRKTGQEVTVVLEAASEKEAVAAAHARGLFVAGCVPERTTKAKVAPSSDSAAKSKPLKA